MTSAEARLAEVREASPPAERDRGALRPTWRAVALFTSGIPLAILLLAFSRALWTVCFGYALVALAIIAADAMLILGRRIVAVSVKEPVRLPVGDAGTIRVDLATMPDLRPTRFTMVLEQTGPAEPPIVATGTSQAGRLSMLLPLRALRRGRIGLDALWLRWPSPLGLVERRWRMRLGRAIDVVPIIRGLRGAALSLAFEEARFGTKVQQSQGEGSEFETMREHVQGLDTRHIDWKRSARHRKLLSKVFRTERNHQIVLAFDTGHLMTEPVEGKTRLDHAIEAGLQLGWISLGSGDLVGSYGFDASVRQFIPPSGGLGTLARLQQGAARLDYTTEETNFTLGLAELNQRLKRRALVVLFTEFVDTVTAELLLDAVHRIANRHAVIFVTLKDPLMTGLIDKAPDTFKAVARSVIAHDLMRDRAIVLERLARMGVQVLDVPVGGLPSGLVNAYLSVKRRGQL